MIYGGIPGRVAKAIVDLLEVIYIDHGQGILAGKAPQPVIAVAPVKDLGEGIGIHLPVAHQQLVQQILILIGKQIIRVNRIDAFQRIGKAIHLYAHGQDIIKVAADCFHFIQGAAGAYHLLGNTVPAALGLIPDGVAAPHFFHGVAVICGDHLHADARIHQPHDLEHLPVGLQDGCQLLPGNTQDAIRRGERQQHLLLRLWDACASVILQPGVVFLYIDHLTEQTPEAVLFHCRPGEKHGQTAAAQLPIQQQLYRNLGIGFIRSHSG